MQSPVNTNTLEPLLNEFILNDQYQQTWRLRELRRQFTTTEYAYFPNLFSPKVFSLLKTEVDRLKKFTLAKNYQPDGPGTSRNMKAFGGVRLLEESAAFSILYIHHEIRTLLREVLDAPVYHSTHKQEVIGLHCLVDKGNTHGWHLDDGAYILIMMFDAPAKDQGGTVEFIPNWKFHTEKFKYDPTQPIEDCVQKCRKENLVREHYHATGDAYLLRGDRALHRVKPLQGEGIERSIVVMGYTYTPEPVYTSRVTGLYDGN
ncbi:MAG: hypothetical protein WBA74_19040 [Cyclobacteriaceae bacterium]